MEEVQREKRKRNLILAAAAFFSGALCYGGIGAVTADKARIIEIDNQFLYILFPDVRDPCNGRVAARKDTAPKSIFCCFMDHPGLFSVISIVLQHPIYYLSDCLAKEKAINRSTYIEIKKRGKK